MKYLNYIFASLILLFVPIYGLLIAVGSAIFLDTFTGIFKSVKLNGWKSIRSRPLSNVISKMALYEICIVFLFLIDKFVLNEFVKHAFGFDFMFTKICAILLIFTELVSIKENIEESYKIDVWSLLKSTFNRAKEIKSDINEITQ
ncbi:phage holin family protein [Flavobacterium sp.]|uniref:phage holin family protein n=1 Tax=Flavobacteriaceae TaxID=49546 RepID=UPI003427ECB7